MFIYFFFGVYVEEIFLGFVFIVGVGISVVVFIGIIVV